MVRALMRSSTLDQKNNGQYNIITGSNRAQIPVPFHDRYNPITNAGAAVMTSNNRKSNLPTSTRRSQAVSEVPQSKRSGAPPVPSSKRSQAPPVP